MRLLPLVLLVGCDALRARLNRDDPRYADADADGWSIDQGDCDDEEPEVYPEAQERCDGLDNDCDGAADEDVDYAFFRDDDGDGLGSTEVRACELPANHVTQGGDCDDSRPATGRW